jgi:hypothetical protein
LLSDIKPDNRKQLICINENEGSFSTYEISFPNYRCDKVFNRVEEIWYNEEFIKLSDYLWDKNSYHLIIGGKNSKPDKKDWARFVFLHIIHGPLLTILNNSGIKSYIKNRKIINWYIDKEIIGFYSELCVNHIIEKDNKEHSFHGLCLIRNIEIKIPDIDFLEFNDTVKLKKLAIFDKCYINTLYHSELLWDDFVSPMFTSSYLLVKTNINTDNYHNVDKDYVADKIKENLDILKLSLFAISLKRVPINEGTCIVINNLEHRFFRFKRQDHLNYGTFEITNKNIDELKSKFNNLISFSKKHKEIDHAIWHFGRACIADLSRDILLESAIGLESLFVHGNGDSTYRFCLHGSSILGSTYNETDTYKLLNKIYQNRSKAAHGEKLKEIDELSITARNLLCLAIDKIINLCNENVLNINEFRSIPLAIQDYVKRKVIV